MLTKITKKTGQTLHQALDNRADYEVGLRFFDNNLVTPEKILCPHFIETTKRCSGLELVAVLQDSSDLDYDYLDVEGFCKMHSNIEKGFR